MKHNVEVETFFKVLFLILKLGLLVYLIFFL